MQSVFFFELLLLAPLFDTRRGRKRGHGGDVHRSPFFPAAAMSSLPGGGGGRRLRPRLPGVTGAGTGDLAGGTGSVSTNGSACTGGLNSCSDAAMSSPAGAGGAGGASSSVEGGGAAPGQPLLGPRGLHGPLPPQERPRRGTRRRSPLGAPGSEPNEGAAPPGCCTSRQ